MPLRLPRHVAQLVLELLLIVTHVLLPEDPHPLQSALLDRCDGISQPRENVRQETRLVVQPLVKICEPASDDVQELLPHYR